MQIDDYLYEKDPHKLLSKVKPITMTHKVVKAQGSVVSRIDLVDVVKNVVFYIIKKKKTSYMLKTLSNMYEKSPAMK